MSELNEFNELEEFKAQIIETFDQDGNAVQLELLDIVEVEGVEYAILREVEEGDDEEDELETEAVLMRLVRNGDEFTFESIDDDEEFNIIADYIAELDDEE